jgi:hypothetical protein
VGGWWCQWWGGGGRGGSVDGAGPCSTPPELLGRYFKLHTAKASRYTGSPWTHLQGARKQWPGDQAGVKGQDNPGRDAGPVLRRPHVLPQKGFKHWEGGHGGRQQPGSSACTLKEAARRARDPSTRSHWWRSKGLPAASRRASNAATLD